MQETDIFDLARFAKAQGKVYENVLAELKNGQKRTHWIWYIFPQLDGLAHSSTSKHYAIKSVKEAHEYLKHSILGKRLLECTRTVLEVEGSSVSEIFGYPDDLKFKSSMTLFALISESDSVFAQVLDKYFGGEQDLRSLDIWEKLKKKE